MNDTEFVGTRNSELGNITDMGNGRYRGGTVGKTTGG